MNRSILKFISCLLATFFLLRLAEIAESQGRNVSSPSQLHYKPKKKTNHTNSNQSLILVPPPPPTQPSLLDWSGLGDIPDSISYLNADELNAKLQRLRKRISNAKLQGKENQLKLAESKEKADRFESLYTEGVVSRKELETAHKEAENMQALSDDDKGNIADLEIQEGAIVRQLNLRLHKKNSSQPSHVHKKTKEHTSK